MLESFHLGSNVPFLFFPVFKSTNASVVGSDGKEGPMAQSECGERAQRRWGHSEGFLQRECLNLGRGFCRSLPGSKWKAGEAIGMGRAHARNRAFSRIERAPVWRWHVTERSNSLGLAGAGWCRA